MRSSRAGKSAETRTGAGHLPPGGSRACRVASGLPLGLPSSGPVRIGPLGEIQGERTMIPTRYRSKLGSTLAYPVGAEAISVALAGVPRVEMLVLSFYARPV